MGHWLLVIGAGIIILALAWPLEREFSRCGSVHPRHGVRCRLQRGHGTHLHVSVDGRYRW